MELAPVFAEQFTSIFDMPRNGPENKKGLAYSFSKENLAVISVDTFEDAGDRMSMTVSGEQLEWLQQTLEGYRDKEFIIVQGHVPVFGPVKSKNSSANMLEGGAASDFWKTMVEPGRLTLELFEFDVEYGGGYLGDHPHRGEKNRPRENVAISEEARRNGPRSVGKLVIESHSEGNRTVLATGVFEPGVE